ncbi:uncharacterized protein LOC109860665 [Pseudomyrmex gracilis]|uniref:uncharacterized protein LOC109860665 n=1 Tax=Pseudomyrmex gracilis TaxID=219809 RepID=UPI00099595C1|nr:uncharacterized protein LOC109860665 [Pseudomyrmex gracilis]
MLLQIPGPGGAEKANALVEKASKALKVERVRFTRPVKHAEVRVRDVVPFLTPEGIGAPLTAADRCQPGEVCTGLVRSSPIGYGTLWARLPLRAAQKVVGGKRIEVGWFSFPVEALVARRMQCYRCLEYGHVARTCTGVDRSRACYRCGEKGHLAITCRAAPKCTLCAKGQP